MKKVIDNSNSLRYLYLVGLSAIIVLVGYAVFIYFPVLFDRNLAFAKGNGNFFLLAAFIFMSLHHYLVDGVIWKHDSLAKQLLTSGNPR